MNSIKVDKLLSEINSLSREEFQIVRQHVDTISYHGNPAQNNSVKKSNSVGAEMVRRMFAAYESRQYKIYADMMELVDKRVLKTLAAERTGSSPVVRTNKNKLMNLLPSKLLS